MSSALTDADSPSPKYRLKFKVPSLKLVALQEPDSGLFKQVKQNLGSKGPKNFDQNSIFGKVQKRITSVIKLKPKQLSHEEKLKQIANIS